MNVRAVGVMVLVWALAGCGANRATMSSAPVSAAAGGPQDQKAKPIQRSLFARDPQGQLSEDKLQEILERPLELELPARVGVMPVVAAEDWRGPGPSYDMAPAALSVFVDKLPSDEAFTLVSEMIPIPSGALGMEALREAAARYKLRYLVLYREQVVRNKRVNAWAIGYSTVVGALFLPGSTLEVDGYVEASLFDVKTGLLMFTVRRRVTARQHSNVWHQGHKLAQLQRRLAKKAGKELAVDLRRGLFRFRAAVEVENERRLARRVAPEGPPTASTRTEQPARLAAEPSTESASGQATGNEHFPTSPHMSGLVGGAATPTKP